MFVGLRSIRYTRSTWFLLLSLLCHFILTRVGIYRNASKRFFTGSSQSSNYGSYDCNSASSSCLVSYQIAVAFQPKDRSDAIYGAKPLKSATGEDNYFLAELPFSSIYAGVADGVGGWVEHGYDSSAISRELCNAIKEEVISSKKPNSPKNLIDKGYSRILNDKSVTVGGTTAIVAEFCPNGMLNVANLGDSWCGVFRKNKLVFQTKYQTVSFNAPYQLAIIPENIRKKSRNGNSFIENTPNDADEYSFQLQSNDIVLLATDGVTDNIAIEDIELFLRDHEDATDLQVATEKFVSLVNKLSKDNQFPSVFSQELSKLTGKPYVGGKEDDITTIVVKVN